MNLFSKNNYKYFIGFLITFILIILVYGNYNLKINVIETLNCENLDSISSHVQTIPTVGSGENKDGVNNAIAALVHSGQLVAQTGSDYAHCQNK